MLVLDRSTDNYHDLLTLRVVFRQNHEISVSSAEQLINITHSKAAINLI